jgi:hypothetical protein
MDYINYCYFMQDQANDRRDQDLEDQMIDQQVIEVEDDQVNDQPNQYDEF